VESQQAESVHHRAGRLRTRRARRPRSAAIDWRRRSGCWTCSTSRLRTVRRGSRRRPSGGSKRANAAQSV